MTKFLYIVIGIRTHDIINVCVCNVDKGVHMHVDGAIIYMP